jgi:predicted nucleic acid-binding Zn ribbon protein
MGKCLQCAARLPDVAGIAYCSRDCREQAKSERKAARNAALPRSTSGALTELLVCVDLARRGWHVFRAISPSCPCDLMIAKGSYSLRVEVKTGYMNLNGSLRHSGLLPANAGFPDIIAIVLGAEEIIYQPELPL